MHLLGADPVSSAGRLNHARAILSKATLTRDIMQRTLGDVWPANLPVEMPEPLK